MKKQFKIQLSSIQIILLGFLGVILLGTLILLLPFATAAGEETSFLTALFTATTSICVTGLVVVDTYSHWTGFGQVVILLLIQLGGFGVITFYSLGMLALHRRFSMKLRLLIQDYYNLNSIQGLIRFLKNVVVSTLLVEGVGAFLYCFVWIPKYGFLRGLWYSVFHSISAFCNAGLDILGPNSLIDYQTNVPVNLITMFLIIMGGLGYVVWFDLFLTFRATRTEEKGPGYFLHHLNEHSKLILSLTAILIFSGALFVWLLERHNPETIGNLPAAEQLLVSLFQSVTFRTAGFATVPQEALTPSTCILGFLYMFIGGSPVGTAGGVKTVTVFILALNAFSYIRGRDETVVYRRRVTGEMINKATAIVTVSFLLTLLITIALIAVTGAPALSAAYEAFSATATVGLSRGLTPTLNAAGQWLIILAMYLGRVGPISMALAFSMNRPDDNDVNYARGHFIIG